MTVQQIPQAATGTEDVCRIAQGLIRIDTTNFGDGKAVGEAKAAEYVTELLTEVGLEPRTFESAPNRTNVVARWKGKNSDLPALMLHGHLDVVPAEPSEWSVDPFGGVIKDGMLWGRGAVDMKNMCAMIIASVREMIKRGEQPNRDIVLAFFADEEDNFGLGSAWMVENHPEQFAGVGDAITEIGGYSVDINGRQVFLIQTAEKGMLWLRLRASGRAGHGSVLNAETAISRLAAVVSRIQSEAWPVTLTASSEALLARLRDVCDLPEDTPPDTVLQAAGDHGPGLMAGLRNISNVTKFNAGYLHCVIPSTATAYVDIRPLPGQRDHVFARIKELAGSDIDIDIEFDIEGFESEIDGPLLEAMTASLRKQVPDAEIAPYMVSGATDNSSLRKLGIAGYGFTPMLVPADFKLMELPHSHDERVPLDALVFGQTVLSDLMRTY